MNWSVVNGIHFSVGHFVSGSFLNCRRGPFTSGNSFLEFWNPFENAILCDKTRLFCHIRVTDGAGKQGDFAWGRVTEDSEFALSRKVTKQEWGFRMREAGKGKNQ
jgi:hypothetical protein